MEQTDPFVTYVNTYYAVQEGLERAARAGSLAPDDPSLAFSREADPFLWDGEASADRSLYEGFERAFRERFGGRAASPEDAYDLAREWLGTLEGGRFGSGLLAAFDGVADRDAFVGSFDAVRDQVLIRREIGEWYPQDEPEAPLPQDPASEEPEGPWGAEGVVSATTADAGVVAKLVAPSDEGLRSSLEGYVRKQMSSGSLLQWLLMRDGRAAATAGLIVVSLPPTSAREGRTVGLVTLCGGDGEALAELLGAIREQASLWGVDEVQDDGLAR